MKKILILLISIFLLMCITSCGNDMSDKRKLMENDLNSSEVEKANVETTLDLDDSAKELESSNTKVDDSGGFEDIKNKLMKKVVEEKNTSKTKSKMGTTIIYKINSDKSEADLPEVAKEMIDND